MLGNSFETHLPNARGINGDESHGTNSLVALNTSMFFSILMVQSSEFSLPFLNNTFSLNVSTNYIYILFKNGYCSVYFKLTLLISGYNPLNILSTCQLICILKPKVDTA